MKAPRFWRIADAADLAWRRWEDEYVFHHALANDTHRLSGPAGSVLTEENLQQLLSHRVEFIHVSVVDERSDEEIAVEAATAARSVMEIFADADLSQPTMAALFDQVLMYRSA